jgi:hypothetical protein
MPLQTGAPLGNIIEQDEIYIEGAPWIYYQRSEADLLFNPDGDGFYYGLSGTVAYPVYALACYEDVSLTEDLTVNVIRCDKVGDKATIQKRNHLELAFALSSLFPLTTTQPIFAKRGSAVTVSGALEKMGIGAINNNIFWHVYLPKVYDEDTGDFVSFTIHRAQFVDPWTLAMPSGDKWTLGGISLYGYADDSKPTDQQFATVIRADPSAVP